ncbi:MAG: GntR family transcriptional regulator [Anaerolineae bacterium]|nr:GntR family transcriptional regulator [Anaerolineae bacterium]
MINLNPNSFTPFYVQIAQILREAINRGDYKPGEKLPSEKELENKFGISRITATAALDELVKERLAYRQRGRGTFVAKAFIGDFSFFSSFTEDMLARGLRPSSHLLSLEVTTPDPVTVEKLKMPLDEPYHCLSRVRLANDEPVVIQRAYLPSKIYPALEQHDFEKQYLYEIIRKVYGYKLMWAEAIVEAGTASAEEAAYLQVKNGFPVLIIWHLTLDEQYKALEYVHSIYRADRFSFSTGRNPLHNFGT